MLIRLFIDPISNLLFQQYITFDPPFFFFGEWAGSRDMADEGMRGELDAAEGISSE